MLTVTPYRRQYVLRKYRCKFYFAQLRLSGVTAVLAVAAAADWREPHVGLWAIPRPGNPLTIVQVEDASGQKLLGAQPIVLRKPAHTGLMRERLDP